MSLLMEVGRFFVRYYFADGSVALFVVIGDAGCKIKQ